MIAYDLDGVLVPDFDKIPGLGGLAEFYAMTTYIRPIFTPQGEYAIITARNAEFRTDTWTWCNKYLSNLPVKLYHEIKGQTPPEYKAALLNTLPDIQVYVESDKEIVEYLRSNVTTGCKIIHFSEYLEKEFNAGKVFTVTH